MNKGPGKPSENQQGGPGGTAIIVYYILFLKILPTAKHIRNTPWGGILAPKSPKQFSGSLNLGGTSAFV
jgi:hypothetical protein